MKEIDKKKVIKCLNKGLSVSETADKLGYNMRTLYRYVNRNGLQDLIQKKYDRMVKPRLEEIRYWLLELGKEKGFVEKELGISHRSFVMYVEKYPELAEIINEWENRRTSYKKDIKPYIDKLRYWTLDCGLSLSEASELLGVSTQLLSLHRKDAELKDLIKEIKKKNKKHKIVKKYPRVVDVETKNPKFYEEFVQELINKGLRVKKLYPVYNGDNYVQEETDKLNAILKAREYDIICPLNLMMIPQIELTNSGNHKPIMEMFYDNFMDRLGMVYIVTGYYKKDRSRFCIDGKVQTNPEREDLAYAYRDFIGLKYVIDDTQYERAAMGVKLAYEKGLF